MSIFFNPPLDKLTSLQLPVHPVDLYFSARFSSTDDHFNARLSGVRVEIWCDVPGNGTIDGQWRALQFDWLEDSLLLIIPSHTLNHPWRTRFSFTYRLVYSNGNIKWLGGYGMNGELVVYKNDERLRWANGWKVDQSALIFSSPDNVQVGQLSENADWALWIWGSESAPRLLTLDDELLNAKSVLLFSRQSSSAIVPFAPILLTSQGTTFSINRSGSITLDSGTLTLQTPSVAELKGLIATIAGSEHVECASPHHTIIHSKSTTVNPTTLSIVSFLSSSPPEFNIPLSKLYRETSEVAICSLSTLEVWFVSSDNCPVTLGFAGSQWLLCPVYELGNTTKVAVLSSHEKNVVPVHAHRLPTPPPSPPLSTTPVQPLHIPEAEVVKSRGTKKQRKSVSYITYLGLISNPFFLLLRRMFSLYTGFWWWIFKLFFRRVLSITNKVFAIMNFESSRGPGTLVRRNHLDSRPVSTRSVNLITSGGSGYSATSSSAEKTELSDTEVHQPVQHNAEHGLTFDIPKGKDRIRLAICELEDKVKELRFTVDGRESKASFAGLDGNVWMVELSETSGRLSIYS